jgi:hypothetical protein
MRIMKIKRVIAIVTLLAAVGLTGAGYANDPPSSESIAFAQRTSDLMLNELLAALFQEFNETTTNNVEEGKQAISLIFNDSNRDMRLIGVFPPLQGGINDLPITFIIGSVSVGRRLNSPAPKVGKAWALL